MRLQGVRTLGESVVPVMPNGKIAFLPIDERAGNEHQLNCHGWPPNNIQEYVNTENASIKEQMIKNLQMNKACMDENASFSDAQKAALCGSRYAQTASEFVTESLRLDAMQAELNYAEKPSVEVPQPDKPTTKDITLEELSE